MPDDASPRSSASPTGARHTRHGAASGAARHDDPHASAPLRPTVTPEERERGRIVGLAALGAAAVVAVVVTIGIFVPALGALVSNAPDPVDASNLPATITVCDVEYSLAAAAPETLEAARARAGGEPVVVGVRATCPEGVCVRNGACLSTVFLKTTDDRFVPYAVEEQAATSREGRGSAS
jgi:hypothetical protein